MMSAAALPFRSTPLNLRCSLANSTFAAVSKPWPSASTFLASVISSLAAEACWCIASSFEAETPASEALEALSDATLASAFCTASAASFTTRMEMARERSRPPSLTLSSLSCAFWRRPKTPRSSLSSRPCAICSFISTCTVVELSLAWTPVMLFSAASESFASLGQLWDCVEMRSTSPSASLRLSRTSASDFPTLIFSSKSLTTLRNLVSSVSM
mmetsp:Transcript_113427/g.366458  ORF Transcript_113427/g.366458 Transcript_113427/m.366458 type:complete len:214 (+) Transcript_113427:1827-2468(+)